MQKNPAFNTPLIVPFLHLRSTSVNHADAKAVMLALSFSVAKTTMRYFLGCLSLLASWQASAADLNHFDYPPSAELHYKIKAKQSGLSVSGEATVAWSHEAERFQVHAETRAMLVGKILDNRSIGSIDHNGLAPERFTEKRLGKTETITTFDRTQKILRFSESDMHYTLNGGEQDRASALWQLIAMARAAGETFTLGSEWKFLVAGRRDADPWSFKVIGKDVVKTALGELETLHVLRAPMPDSKDQQLDIWLAPKLEWYPVRLKFTDADQSFIDQTLESIKR